MKIERDVPIPNKSSAGGRKYPFHEMVVGDSFFVPVLSSDEISKIRSAAYGYGKTNDMAFMTLTVPGGCRVWRKE